MGWTILGILILLIAPALYGLAVAQVFHRHRTRREARKANDGSAA